MDRNDSSVQQSGNYNIKEDLEKQLTKINKVIDPINIQLALDQAAIVAVTNQQGIITYVNEKFLEISKYERDELIGNTHRILNSGYHPSSFFKEMWDTIKTGNIWTGEIQNRAKDDSIYWVSTTIVPFLNECETSYQFVAIRTDITARMQMEKDLQDALENDFETTIKQLSNLIFKVIRNENNDFIFVMSEGRLGEKINFTTDKVKNKSVYTLFDSDTAQVLEQHFQEAYKGKHVKLEIELWNIYFLVHLAPIYKGNKVKEVLGTTFDITERKKSEEKVKYMAYHDQLTDLPNRTYILDKLKSEIEANRPFSLLFLDLDRFKNVNDSLGHSVGDKLLKAFSERLLTFNTAESFVARFGGDEFLMILYAEDKREITRYANDLADTLSGFYQLGDLETYISPSIGISKYPADGKTPDELIKNADAAMYQAKSDSQSRGETSYYFYNPRLTEDLKRKVLVETELRKAIDEQQFELYYQPQVNIKKNKIVGVEALIRWNHPDLGIISPLDFITLAEETGLIIPIGEWILKTATKQAKKWQDAGYPKMTMAINVSVRQFMSKGFTELVKETLNDIKLHPKYLELEITESLTVDVKYAEQILNEFQEIGVNISIDDFGSGYSSLNYLSNLSINKLKIDRVFLLNFTEENKTVVKAIIALAQNLNIEVLAEGVETEDHVHFLKYENCYLVQGYHYFRPLQTDDLEVFLESGVPSSI